MILLHTSLIFPSSLFALEYFTNVGGCIFNWTGAFEY